MILLGKNISVIPHSCQKCSYKPFVKKESEYNKKIHCSGDIILITFI